MTEDDHNGCNSLIDEEETNIDAVTERNIYIGEDSQSNTLSTERCVPKMALNYIFELGVDKMNELNIPKQRERENDRLKRTNTFFNFYELVGGAEDTIEDDLDFTNKNGLFAPWCCRSYRSALPHSLSYL